MRQKQISKPIGTFLFLFASLGICFSDVTPPGVDLTLNAKGVYVSNQDQPVSVKVYDLHGKVLFSQAFTKGVNTLNLPKEMLANTVRIFRVTVGNVVYTRKVMPFNTQKISISYAKKALAKTVDDIANGKVINTVNLVLPYSLPGQTVTLSKVLQNGQIGLQSASPLVKTWQDLVTLENNERKAKRARYGNLSDGLIGRVVQGRTDSVRVLVALKPKNHPPFLDKTTHSEAELQANSLLFLDRTPRTDKGTILGRNALAEEADLGNPTRTAEFQAQPDAFVADVDANTLRNLSFDMDVESVEEYKAPEPCVCHACSTMGYPSRYWRTSPVCLSTLAAYAKSPAGVVPPSTWGAGVNAATFESGIRKTFVDCASLAHMKYYDVAYNQVNNYDDEPLHAETCFRLLAFAAPGANLYHLYYQLFNSGYDDSAIIKYGLQTISCSMTASNWPGGPDMRRIDSWAFRWPYPVFCNPTANGGYYEVPDWGCYNAISVGNVLASTNYPHNGQAHYMQYAQTPTGYCTYMAFPEQAFNPETEWGGTASSGFDCSLCLTGASRSDREMPMIVAPGISPALPLSNGSDPTGVATDGSRLSDFCLHDEMGGSWGCASMGTSYSAPVTNGIAADVISASSDVVNWPEKVRAALLATAQDIDGRYWASYYDGVDGAGVISGDSAVSFVQHCPHGLPVNACADSTGIHYQAPSVTGLLGGIVTSNSRIRNFNILTPPTIPSGKHLRIVLTWDSTPDSAQGGSNNDLADLDLVFWGTSAYYSASWEDNVEMIDYPNSYLSPGTNYQATIQMNYWRGAPPDIERPFQTAVVSYYSIAWTWVPDYAN